MNNEFSRNVAKMLRTNPTAIYEMDAVIEKLIVRNMAVLHNAVLTIDALNGITAMFNDGLVQIRDMLDMPGTSTFKYDDILRLLHDWYDYGLITIMDDRILVNDYDSILEELERIDPEFKQSAKYVKYMTDIHGPDVFEPVEPNDRPINDELDVNFHNTSTSAAATDYTHLSDYTTQTNAHAPELVGDAYDLGEPTGEEDLSVVYVDITDAETYNGENYNSDNATLTLKFKNMDAATSFTTMNPIPSDSIYVIYTLERKLVPYVHRTTKNIL